ncbi:MAG: tRNA 2-thiocytidine biosynthesis protein TtcA [Clostridia bacterium]|nr:tRNA 2-thiocytidine biosynthesis protein TtcA [Clostridia bacterium]
MSRQLSPCGLIEQSITLKFRKTIWHPFVAAMKKYELLSEGDRVAVCISGGKDSMLLAKLMQMLQRYSDFPFELEYIVMDPGYLPENRQRIIYNAARLELPIKIFDTDIFDTVVDIESSPCYLCARMRRGHLYSFAKSLGCNKIALGHHFNDVIETLMMSILYGSQIQGMLPKLHSTNFEGMQLIRPLYMVHEDAIMAWRDHNGFSFLQCACRFTERAHQDIAESKRMEVKQLIADLKINNPQVDENIFNSMNNVCIDTLCEYKTDGVRHSFLERFSRPRRAADGEVESKKSKGILS